MKESTLKKFFEGKISGDILLSDLVGASSINGDITRFRIEDMDKAFTVTPFHLARVCELALSGKLHSAQLKTIGFCLQASDTFKWDVNTEEGSRVAELVFYLSSPEVYFESNINNVSLFEKLIVHGGNLLEKAT